VRLGSAAVTVVAMMAVVAVVPVVVMAVIPMVVAVVPRMGEGGCGRDSDGRNQSQ
jgi:competence protein ComGC